MTLEDLILQQFKVKTRANINPEVSRLTGGVDKVLSNNPNRLGWIIILLGSNVAYGGFDRDVGSSKGFRFAPSGGVVKMIWSEDFDMVGYEVFMKGTSLDYIYVFEVVTAE